MAVATPVLERKTTTEETEAEQNARIRRNYAMLINPEMKLDDILGRNISVEAASESTEAAATSAVVTDKPYLVENARADADIFRADNPVNRKAINVEMISEEDESEDLRPTLTTIQYKSTDVKKTVEESKVENIDAGKRTSLTKKEKIIIAVVVSFVVALFALIIINSTIISGLNRDLSSLQSSLTTVKAAYAGISDDIKEYLTNGEKIAAEFAWLNGLIK